MSWYLRRYIKIILKYREIKGTLGTTEFEELLKDFYKIEGENKARWLFDKNGNAWFNYVDNDEYYSNNPVKEQIYWNFEKLLINELEQILE